MFYVEFFLILYLMTGIAKLFLRNRERYDYHADPYYYYPRNSPPPPSFSGYSHQPKEPYIPPFQAPYRPNVPYASKRPVPWFAAFIKMSFRFLLKVAFVYGLYLGGVYLLEQSSFHNQPDSYDLHVGHSADQASVLSAR